MTGNNVRALFHDFVDFIYIILFFLLLKTGSNHVVVFVCVTCVCLYVRSFNWGLNKTVIIH